MYDLPFGTVVLQPYSIIVYRATLGSNSMMWADRCMCVLSVICTYQWCVWFVYDVYVRISYYVVGVNFFFRIETFRALGVSSTNLHVLATYGPRLVVCDHSLERERAGTRYQVYLNVE